MKFKCLMAVMLSLVCLNGMAQVDTAEVVFVTTTVTTAEEAGEVYKICLLYTSPSPRD